LTQLAGKRLFWAWMYRDLWTPRNISFSEVGLQLRYFRLL
jgi:hypothetical protein